MKNEDMSLTAEYAIFSRGLCIQKTDEIVFRYEGGGFDATY